MGDTNDFIDLTAYEVKNKLLTRDNAVMSWMGTTSVTPGLVDSTTKNE